MSFFMQALSLFIKYMYEKNGGLRYFNNICEALRFNMFYFNKIRKKYFQIFLYEIEPLFLFTKPPSISVKQNKKARKELHYSMSDAKINIFI